MGSCDTLDTARKARSQPRARARLAPALLSALTRHGTIDAVTRVLADLLPDAFDARRVAIGLSTGVGEPIRIQALSGQANLDPRRRPVRRQVDCLNAMAVDFSGATDEDAGIRVWPEHGDVMAHCADHAVAAAVLDHARGCAAGSLACLTLSDATGARLVLLFDRAIGERSFAAVELVPLRRALQDVAGWLLAADHRQGRWYRRARGAWQTRAGGLSAWTCVLPRALTDALTPRRTLLAAALTATACFALLPVSRIVTAVATLEAEHRQVVGAAYEGHLLAVHVRAGDRVRKGQLLARLDDREASNELSALRESARRANEERSRALALRDRASLGRLRAEQARIEADLAAAKRRLEGSRVVAPFDGVVLAGDLDDRLGAPVQAGERLFELGADSQVRLMLSIDERDVRLVKRGLPARVRMASLPMHVLSASLQDLEPVAIAEPGKNVFRMAASLNGESSALRPGMRGVARIDTGRQALSLVWTRALRERFTVLAWRVGLLG